MLNPSREVPFPRILKHFWGKLRQRSTRAFTLLFAVGLSLSLAVTACNSKEAVNPTANTATGNSTTQASKVIRIGYQKYGTMNILKARGSLEQRLKPEGVSVQWTQFPGGPQLLEALNAGSLDFGHTGEAPPVFAQAANAPLVYAAHEPPNPKGEAIIVPKDSPIKDVAGLKGKKVALNKGSNVHYLLVEALKAAGLKYSDIQPVYLPPADARAAFEKRSVDAWVIWEPFLTVAQRATGARTLKDGEGLVSNFEFYLATKSFSEQQPNRVKTILEELQKVDDWAATKPTEVAKQLSPELGIDVPTLEEVAKKRLYGVKSITEDVVTNQQKIADTFYELKLIPKQLKVSEVAKATK